MRSFSKAGGPEDGHGRRRSVEAGASTAGAAEWGAGKAATGSEPNQEEDKMTVSDHGALHAINIAIAANFVIFLSKLGVYCVSGSSAMLAEAIHSIADVANQGLLRTGVLKSLQGPTPSHPYGYSRDRFVWSLISAVGIFCLGAGVSIVHGINSFMHEYAVENLGWGMLVLAISLVLEGYSLAVALKTVTKARPAVVPHQMMLAVSSLVSGQRPPAPHWGRRIATRGCSLTSRLCYAFQCSTDSTASWDNTLGVPQTWDDPTTNAIVMEDAGAVAGLIIAGMPLP
ncbi:uncharacterized protein LOC142356350 [Convolutriloba macropyga]|uniref:uncharacterized protein LOC142356350 n=1 Tax=Convolutriloba macropyga TaxID=536237 RepID=UPI003F51C8D1